MTPKQIRHAANRPWPSQEAEQAFFDHLRKIQETDEGECRCVVASDADGVNFAVMCGHCSKRLDVKPGV